MSFGSVISSNCDVCGLMFRPALLNLVTFKNGLFFVCEGCCEKILLIDGWRNMTSSEIRNVLDL